MGRKNIKIEFRYDGSRYYGFQRQPNKITVQGEIEKILRIVTKEEINLISAGRTDRGVHANHQVSNFLISIFFFTNLQYLASKGFFIQEII